MDVLNEREVDQLRTLYDIYADVTDSRVYRDNIKRALRGEYPSVIVRQGQSNPDETKLDDFLKRLAQIINHNEPLKGWSKRIDKGDANTREVIQWISSKDEKYAFKYSVWYVNGRRFTGEVTFHNMNGTDHDSSGNDTDTDHLHLRMVSEIQRLHERLSVLENLRNVH